MRRELEGSIRPERKVRPFDYVIFWKQTELIIPVSSKAG